MSRLCSIDKKTDRRIAMKQLDNYKNTRRRIKIKQLGNYKKRESSAQTELFDTLQGFSSCEEHSSSSIVTTAL